jgi:hypothetical protein
MRNLTRKIILFLIITFPTTVFAEDFTNGGNFDFRKAKWGMTLAEVKKSEEISVHDSSDKMLLYHTVLNQKDAEIEYLFSNGKLTQATYTINEGYYDPADTYDDFVMFEEVLKNKYGKPASVEKIGVGTESIRKSLSEPVAMSLGYLILKSTWDLSKTSILHVLQKSPTNAGLKHDMVFTPK